MPLYFWHFLVICHCLFFKLISNSVINGALLEKLYVLIFCHQPIIKLYKLIFIAYHQSFETFKYFNRIKILLASRNFHCCWILLRNQKKAVYFGKIIWRLITMFWLFLENKVIFQFLSKKFGFHLRSTLFHEISKIFWIINQNIEFATDWNYRGLSGNFRSNRERR